MELVTQDLLKESLTYYPDTGVFVWSARNSNRINVGGVAGRICRRGYVLITLWNRRYYAHRLAWLYVYGFFPENQIDHINHKKSDNRITNLRLVTHNENLKNQSVSRKNTSGITGVTWNRANGKWRSQIIVNGRNVYLGCYVNIAEAARVRQLAESKYGFHINHGKKLRQSYE